MFFPTKKYRFLVFLLLYCGFSFAQDDYAFEALTTEQGLSENVVICIYQDRKGLMWFGTYDGLNVYDGYRFRIYRHDPDDSTSLAGNGIYTIMQDKSGRYWVGTNNGCGILNPVSGVFSKIPFGKNSFNEAISRIIEIGEHEYMLCNEYHVFLFNSVTNVVTPVYCHYKSGDKAKFGLIGRVIYNNNKLYAKIWRWG